MTSEATDNPILKKMVHHLAESLGERLHSVILYGSAARGDYEKATSDLNLIVVLKSLDPASLVSLVPAIARWQKQGQPLPRIFSPELITESLDVFPIEFLDIKSRRIVLHGKDPFADVQIHLDHLRLQCERELREKMMRLREGFIETHGKPKQLRRLLTDSYTSFVALFRGCLHLLGEEAPIRNHDVVAAFCARAELDPAPFNEVDRLKHGDKSDADLKPLFSRYYEELTKAVHRVNRFEPQKNV